MSSTFNLQRLLEFAEQQSGKAAASLGTLNREHTRQQEKFALLVGYRTEYQERLRRAIAQGLDGAGLRNFYDFMERLEQAIAQQQQIVANSQARAAGGRQEWQKKQIKYKAFDALSQRFHTAMQKRDASRDQKAMDDFSGRRHRGPGTQR